MLTGSCRRSCLQEMLAGALCVSWLIPPLQISSVWLQVSAGALSGWSAMRWAVAKLRQWQRPAGARAHVAWCLGWALQPS